jgi:hypothetical protein
MQHATPSRFAPAVVWSELLAQNIAGKGFATSVLSSLSGPSQVVGVACATHHSSMARSASIVTVFNVFYYMYTNTDILQQVVCRSREFEKRGFAEKK